jgi:hypothetical protein
MCGRVRLSSDISEIKIAFGIPSERPTPNFAASWNVAPTDPIPVVRYDAKDHQVGPDPLLGEGYQDRFLDHQRRRQRVGQPTGQHPSGCPVDDRDQSPGSAAKSKCMRDRNLGMSGSRETRVAPGSIGVRSRLPAGGSRIRTLGPPAAGSVHLGARDATHAASAK